MAQVRIACVYIRMCVSYININANLHAHVTDVDNKTMTKNDCDCDTWFYLMCKNVLDAEGEKNER